METWYVTSLTGDSTPKPAAMHPSFPSQAPPGNACFASAMNYTGIPWFPPCRVIFHKDNLSSTVMSSKCAACSRSLRRYSWTELVTDLDPVASVTQRHSSNTPQPCKGAWYQGHQVQVTIQCPCSTAIQLDNFTQAAEVTKIWVFVHLHRHWQSHVLTSSTVYQDSLSYCPHHLHE